MYLIHAAVVALPPDKKETQRVHNSKLRRKYTNAFRYHKTKRDKQNLQKKHRNRSGYVSKCAGSTSNIKFKNARRCASQALVVFFKNHPETKWTWEATTGISGAS